MNNKFGGAGKVVHWARANMEVWNIVSGITPADIDCNCTIMQKLCDDGLHELADMMALRIYQMLYDLWLAEHPEKDREKTL